MALNARGLLYGSIQAASAVAEFCFVDYAGNQAATQGMACRGVARYAANEGDWLTITEKGSEIVIAGAAIAAGAPVITDANGHAIPATGALKIAAGATEVTSSAANGAILTGSTMPEEVMGHALNAATAEGQFVEVLLK